MARVLVVDDNAPNRLLLRRILEGHGFEVDEAANGAEALKLARRQQPAFVISDLLMPVMDGYRLLYHWRDDPALKAIPFIVCTATYKGERERQLALVMGADEFVIKPVDAESLAAVIQRVQKPGEGNHSQASESSEAGQDVLEEYNKVLIDKLGHKVDQLEQANLQLFERSQYLQALVENTPESVRVIDFNGAILDTNPAGVSLLEAESRELVLQQSEFDFIESEFHEAFRQQLEQAQAGESSTVEMKLVNTRGRRRIVESRAVPLHDAQGDISNCLVLTRDITRLKYNEAKLREFPAHLISVQEEERNRIAREIHDNYGQQLAHVAFGIQSIQNNEFDDPEELNERLGELRGQIRELSSELQDLSYTLAPIKLAQLGLEGAIENLCREAFRQHDLAVSFSCNDLPEQIDEAVELSIYRITQEAIRNIWSHSKASDAVIELKGMPHARCISLSIQDDGVGFEYLPEGPSSGMGLINLRERALSLGGQFSINTKPGEGTRLRVLVPPTNTDNGVAMY